MKMTERDKARFWIKVKQTNRCWIWNGSTNKHGYGVFNHKYETLSHRISYQIIYGEILNSLHVLHKCDNPKCVNPDHLFTVTHHDNMNDKMKKGRSRMFGRSSIYFGVGWRNDSKKWRAYIILNKKLKHIGSYKEEIEAAKAHDKVAFELNMHNQINFPDNVIKSKFPEADLASDQTPATAEPASSPSHAEPVHDHSQPVHDEHQ